jgi:apolipoprotein N-acyltransferase
MPTALPAAAFVLALGWGTVRLAEIRAVNAPQQPVALLQANMQIEQQGGVKRVGIDTQRYLDLTRQVNDPSALVVWPESALQAVVPTDIGDRRRFERFDALFPPRQPMLIGTMTLDNERHRYNSALALLADGRIPEPYHKRILMPFGETMPFLKLFPWLATLNASFVPIDAGERAIVFRYSDVLAAAPLICYEDLVPAMSREATQAGATLLANLTNDVWFGDTVAPRQHNLIASFRAIENRRWLVRATNTGTTSVVAPTGETIAALPGFSEGTLRANVGLLAGETLYTRYLGDKLWWAIALLACAASAWQWRARHRRP